MTGGGVIAKPYVMEAFQNKAYDFSDGMSMQDFREYMLEEHRDVAAHGGM